ncbi:MAG: NAD(P)H-dependent oxidoreductase [Pseudobacteriovorax sp.]|nr:NAD(P)H-dependent oxidoreductase [Pseudobacteriovorax sp.]
MGIYHLDASSRVKNSVSRRLSQKIVDRLLVDKPQSITYRDLGKAEGLNFLDETIVSGLFLSESDRSPAQKAALEASDTIVAEAEANDIWVIGLPIYNFSVPASFKAWADMLARSKKTFRYGEDGPEGLLKNKRLFVAIVSGGTAIDSDIDFCTPWLRHFLSFLGVEDLSIIYADRFSSKKEESILKQIEQEVSQREF